MYFSPREIPKPAWCSLLLSIRRFKLECAVLPVLMIAVLTLRAQSLDNLPPKKYTNLTFTSPTDGKQMLYSVYPPAGYTRGQRIPVLVYMHGTTPRSTWMPEAMSLENYPIDSFPFFLIEPYCPTDQTCWTNTGWNTGPAPVRPTPTPGIRMTHELIDYLVSYLRLDSNRVYIHGNSNGGYAAWDMLARWPRQFAAALIVCGAGDPSKAYLMVDISIWAWHSTDDDIVPFIGTKYMIDSLIANGGWPLYNYLSGYGHYAWNAMRERQKDVFAWMFAQERKLLGPPVFSKPLQNLSVTEGDSVVLTVDFAGSGFLTWKKNGIVIPGADSSKLLPLPRIKLGDDGTTYSCEIVNKRGSATTSGTLKVSADKTPPELLQVITGTPTKLMLVFSEALDEQSATKAANYALDNSASVISAAMGLFPFNVELTTSTLIEGRTYRLTVNGVQDRAAARNTIASTTSMQFVFNERRPGLKYKYYKGSFSSARSLYQNPPPSPSKEGTISYFDVTGQTEVSDFGYHFNGYILISTPGTYTFYVSSDDGSLLYVNNKLVVDNDGSHGMMVKSGTLELTRGYQAVDLFYFQGSYGMGLTVQWEGPGIPKSNIPQDVLWHSPVSGSTGVLKPYAESLPCQQSTAHIVRKGNISVLRILAPSATDFHVALYDSRGVVRYFGEARIDAGNSYGELFLNKSTSFASRYNPTVLFARIEMHNRVFVVPVQ